jgi:hypothetical protein
MANEMNLDVANARIDTLVREVDRLAVEVVNLQAGRTALLEAKDEAVRLRNEAVAEAGVEKGKLNRFQAQVREVAIRVAQENDWCNGGLNDVLEELGLPKYTPKWTVTATMVVEAEDAYDAQSLVEDALGGSDKITDIDVPTYNIDPYED